MSRTRDRRKPSTALKRAVIYLRVSSDQQVRNEYDPEGNSLHIDFAGEIVPGSP